MDINSFIWFRKSEIRALLLLSLVVGLIALLKRIAISEESSRLLSIVNQIPEVVTPPYDSISVDLSLPIESAKSRSEAAINSRTSLSPAAEQLNRARVEVASSRINIDYEVELNSADSIDLLPLKAIGPVRAGRIVKFRSLLGGFYDKRQLLEVYSLDSDVMSVIEGHLSVDSTLIDKINIYSCTFKELLRHPYCSYEMTKSIFNMTRSNSRIERGDIVSLDSIFGPKLIKYLDLDN